MLKSTSMMRRALATAAARPVHAFSARQASASAVARFAGGSRSYVTALQPSNSLARARRVSLRSTRLLSTQAAHTRADNSNNHYNNDHESSEDPSANAAGASSAGLGKKLAALAALGAVGGGLYWNTYVRPLMDTPDIIVAPVMAPPLDFVHPYDSRPWYWRAMFRAKRIFTLIVLWVPCAAVSVVLSVTENEAWRKYWLALLVSTLESAGCTFQKFGQWLSMRPDIFPPDVIEALAGLRDSAPTHAYEHTRRMVLESFGKELEEIFEEFDETPVASGTVAQVHRARLREDMMHLANVTGPNGELVREVAVKVRHPHVLEETWVDLDLLFAFVNRTECMVIPFRKDDFALVMQKQLDFNWEAHNLQKFAANFHKEIKDGKLHFPTVSTELLSSSILVESWANGNTVSDIFSEVGDNFQQVVDAGKGAVHQFGESIMQTKRELARTVFDMNMKMFLRDNLVHGDLHGGNVLFSEEDRTCTVIDAGLTTSIEADVKASFGQFLHALCTGDTQRLVYKLIEFQSDDVKEAEQLMSPAELAELETKRENFRVDLEECMAKFIAQDGSTTAPDGSPISLGDVMGQLVFALQRHQIQLRGDVAASIMTMSVSEGLIRSLDPEFDVVRNALPYFVRYNNWATAGTSAAAAAEQNA